MTPLGVAFTFDETSTTIVFNSAAILASKSTVAVGNPSKVVVSTLGGTTSAHQLYPGTTANAGEVALMFPSASDNVGYVKFRAYYTIYRTTTSSASCSLQYDYWKYFVYRAQGELRVFMDHVTSWMLF